MTKLQHTPGPWKCYNTDPVETELDIVIESQFLTMGWLYSSNENSEANARLIAAAPEMLEELINFCRYNCTDCSGHIEGCSETCGLKNAKAIIEKATGLKIEEVLTCTE